MGWGTVGCGVCFDGGMGKGEGVLAGTRVWVDSIAEVVGRVKHITFSNSEYGIF